MRERLLKEISLAAKQLGEELVALLVPELERIRDRALDEAKAKLRADLETWTAPAPKPVAKPRRKKRRTRSVVTPARTPTKLATSSSSSRVSVPTRAVPGPKSTAPSGAHRSVCSVCQQPGHNARTCPKREAASAKAAPSKDARPRISVDLDDPPTPRLSTAERVALEKPCRDPNCRIAKLHAAHGGFA